MKYLLQLPLLIFLFFLQETNAQNVIKGIIISSQKKPLAQATISIKDSIHDSTIAFAISKHDGTFTIRAMLNKSGIYLLIVEHINSSTRSISFTVSSGNEQFDFGEILLGDSIRELQNIVIKSAPLPFSIRGDTIEFRAKSYKSAETKKVEDIIKNIQGFELSGNGKISFNGKEVDRILIEGEDLTEKNYQLLSRNLNANLVDKIQVINNFSTDRLTRDVEKSGKIGINLTIDNNYKNKLSGSIELGAGAGEREYFENNLVLINKKIKLLSFINYNETGLPANSNLSYYFNQENSEGAVTSTEAAIKGIIQTGNIYLPQLGQQYIRDNEDLSGFVIGSWRPGKHIKMKALTGIGKSKLMKNAEGVYQYLPADGDSWSVLQQDKFGISSKEALVKFSLTHDGGKNNVGTYTADILGNETESSYGNYSYGAITDTLLEQLNNSGVYYRITGNETFRMGQGKIIKININLNREDILQDLKARTNRYQEFFMLDSNFLFFNQQVDGDLSSQEFDLTMLGRKNKTTWYTGLRFIHESNDYFAKSNAFDQASQLRQTLGQPPSLFDVSRISFYGLVNMPLNKKGEFSVGGSTGFGKVKSEIDYRQDQISALIYRGLIGYRYSISSVKSISFQYDYSRQVPERSNFYPVHLLSGQATILNPAQQLAIKKNHLISFSYASHNLLKNIGFVFYTSFSHTDGSYSYSTDRTPSYGFLYFLAQNGTQFLTANLKFDKYINRIRTKFFIQLSSVYSSGDLIFNKVMSRNKMNNINIQPKFVTAFRFPVNMEASITAMYGLNETVPDTGAISRFSLWSYQGYGKVKFNPGEKIYLAAMYNYYLLSPSNFFNTMDLFANFSLDKSWTFSVTVHNLFNASTIVQRQLSVNSVSEQRYELVDRYLMFKALWSF